MPQIFSSLGQTSPVTPASSPRAHAPSSMLTILVVHHRARSSSSMPLRYWRETILGGSPQPLLLPWGYHVFPGAGLCWNFIRSLLAPSSSLSSSLDRSPALKCTDRSPCRCEESALHHLLEITDTDVKQDHSLQTPTVPRFLLASFKKNVSFCTSRSLSHPKARF